MAVFYTRHWMYFLNPSPNDWIYTSSILLPPSTWLPPPLCHSSKKIEIVVSPNKSRICSFRSSVICLTDKKKNWFAWAFPMKSLRIFVVRKKKQIWRQSNLLYVPCRYYNEISVYSKIVQCTRWSHTCYTLDAVRVYIFFSLGKVKYVRRIHS